MAQRQMQLAMEGTVAWKGRDMRAIRWLIDNLTEDAEMKKFLSATVFPDRLPRTGARMSKGCGDMILRHIACTIMCSWPVVRAFSKTLVLMSGGEYALP